MYKSSHVQAQTRRPLFPSTFTLISSTSPAKRTSPTQIIKMPRAKKFKGPLVSPLAIKFNAMDNYQPCSPLLNLCPEIRNLIYHMILSPDEPLTLENHPPFRVDHKLSLSLLSTCRQIYLEAHQYPIYNTMHIDAIFPCRRRLSVKAPSFSRHAFYQLTDWQKSTVDEIHLVIELCDPCFERGLFLKVLLSRTGMAAHLCKLHLLIMPENEHRYWAKCQRANYWKRRNTLHKAWDLKNFLQLKEITMEFAIGTRYSGIMNLTTVFAQARSWCFHVGGSRVLNLDSHQPVSGGSVPSTYMSALILRWL